ncbi:MAG: NINE protein [Armatimonadota bacterium]
MSAKGTRKIPCPNCGKTIWATDHVCMYCGHEMPGFNPNLSALMGSQTPSEPAQQLPPTPAQSLPPQQPARPLANGSADVPADRPAAPATPAREVPAEEPQWFVRRMSDSGTVPSGPYTQQAVKQMLVGGQLAWEDEVSREGSDRWEKALRMREFTRDPDLAPTLPTQQAVEARRPVARVPRLARRTVPRASRGGARSQTVYSGPRQPVVAAVLALLFGSLGAHKFYNGSWGWGLLYLACWWTGLSWLVAVVEAIIYLTDPHRYDQRYNQTPPSPWKW